MCKNILFIAFIFWFLVGCNPDKKSAEFSKNDDSEEIIEVNRPFDIPLLPEEVSSILDDKPIYNEGPINVYLRQELGENELIYIKKNRVPEELLNSKFFLHIFPSDQKNIKDERYTFNGMDFSPSFQKFWYNSYYYYIIRKPIPNYSIDKIETGQFDYNGTEKRFWESEFDIPSKDELYKNTFENITLIIDKIHFEKIEKKRQKSLEIGIIEAKAKKYYPLKMVYKGDTLTGELKLKGDWTDHIKHEYKWSYKIKLDDDQAFQGMRKFSIQHPKTRAYLFEWFMHKVSEMEELISLRYDFINVDLIVDGEEINTPKKLGIFALEEGFDKRLIENNNRREGVIVKFDEEIIWKDRIQSYKSWQNQKLVSPDLQDIGRVMVYSEKKTLKKPALKSQLINAKDALYAYKEGKVIPTQIMDIKNTAMYTAVSNLIGTSHGIILHNLRWYFNPLTSLLEPIPFDGSFNKPRTNLIFFPKTNKDIRLLKETAKALFKISREEYISNLFKDFDKELRINYSGLATEFKNDPLFDKHIIYQNAAMIRKFIDPSTTIICHFESINSKELKLSIENKTEFGIQLSKLSTKDTLITALFDEKPLLPKEKRIVKIALPKNFDHLFVSKKNPTGKFSFEKNFSKLKVYHTINGLEKEYKESISPFSEFDEVNLNQNLEMLKPNYSKFGFMHTNEENKTITFQSGNHKIWKTIIIPEGYTVLGNKGLLLDLQNNVSIISYSPMRFVGKLNNPIIITSSNNNGNGIFVNSTSDTSFFKNVAFDALSNPKTQTWNLTGAFTFYEANVIIDSCQFINNSCEDALNVFRGYLSMNNCYFENNFADAFDGDFVTGEIRNTKFVNVGNDGIDVSGSNLLIDNVYMSNIADKGISVGENSHTIVNNTTIAESEIGYVSKDLSTLTGKNLAINNCKVGFTAFQKKSEFGAATIEANSVKMNNVQILHLIETNSQMILNGNVVTTQDSVINLMYGAEFGKKSIR